MTRWEKFRLAAAELRREQPPTVDVTSAVCDAIRARRRQEAAREPWLIAGAAALSLAAALAAILLALPAWQEAYEFARILPNPLALVLQ